jgi:hypothetical protein
VADRPGAAARARAFADDEEFWAQWREVKRQNKLDLAFHALHSTGITMDPASLFDVMVKRLHEYKRQLLELLHIVTLYNRIKADPAAAVTPCTVIFGAKAAPGYHEAKHIIKLINSVAAVVNADRDVAGRIKVVFLPDYNVSVSELVVAAGNVSEQISLAGKEASGTGNMKLARRPGRMFVHATSPRRELSGTGTFVPTGPPRISLCSTMMNLTSGVLFPADRKLPRALSPGCDYEQQSPAEHSSRIPLPEDG